MRPAQRLFVIAGLAALASLAGCAMPARAGGTLPGGAGAVSARGGGPSSEPARVSGGPLALPTRGSTRESAQPGFHAPGPWGWMYDSAAQYYGGRHDDRWRYYDGARPEPSGGSHWYGGPPYDRPGW